MLTLISIALLLFFSSALALEGGASTEDVLLEMAEELGCELDVRDFLVVFDPKNLPTPESKPIQVVKKALKTARVVDTPVSRDSRTNDVWIVHGREDVEKAFQLISSLASGHNAELVRAQAARLAKSNEKLLLAVRKVSPNEVGCDAGGLEFSLFDFDLELVYVMVPAACDEALNAVRDHKRKLAALLAKR